MQDIQELRELGEKELSIFHAEMQRQQRSVLVTYLLWFFLGWAGGHKYYLGRTALGLVYLALAILGYTLFFSGFLMALADPSAGSPGASASTLGLLALAILGVLWLWDMVTIPRQLQQREASIRRRLLEQLRATKPEQRSAEASPPSS